MDEKLKINYYAVIEIWKNENQKTSLERIQTSSIALLLLQI